MAGFLYFFEDAVSANGKQIEDFGLTDILVGGSFCYGQIDRGPNGGKGVLVALKKADVKLRFDADVQEWQRVPAGYWLGLDRSCPPGPDDLAKAKQAFGDFAKLGDGNAWMIPVARVFGGGTNLMCNYGFDADGKVVPKLERLNERVALAADRIYNWYSFNDETQAMTRSESLQAAADALSINYHVGLYEAVFLNLLNEENIDTVFYCLLDAHERYKAAVEAGLLSEEEVELKKKSGKPGTITGAPV